MMILLNIVKRDQSFGAASPRAWLGLIYELCHYELIMMKMMEDYLQVIKNDGKTRNKALDYNTKETEIE